MVVGGLLVNPLPRPEARNLQSRAVDTASLGPMEESCRVGAFDRLEGHKSHATDARINLEPGASG